MLKIIYFQKFATYFRLCNKLRSGIWIPRFIVRRDIRTRVDNEEYGEFSYINFLHLISNYTVLSVLCLSKVKVSAKL